MTMMENKDLIMLGLTFLSNAGVVGGVVYGVGKFAGIVKTRLNGQAEDIERIQKVINGDIVRKDPFNMLKQEVETWRKENRDEHQKLQDSLDRLTRELISRGRG